MSEPYTGAPRMSLQDEAMLSFYQPVASLSPGHPVTLVQHQATRRVYVRKDLSVFNEAVYRFLQQHSLPGLPRIELVVHDADRLIVIEEFIDGSTLAEKLSAGGPFYEADAARLMQRICETVRNLHRLIPPIILRDLKPSNIMVGKDGSVWLIDLNAAKFMDRPDPHTAGAALPHDTQLIGTQGYAAPEQYGFGTSTIQTDIYALGVIFRALLTGDAGSAGSLPPEAARIIQHATEIDPAKRYASLDGMITDLSRLSGLPSNRERSMLHPYAPPGYRRGIFWHGLVATLYYLPVLFLGFFMTWPGRSQGYIWYNRISFILLFLLIPFVSFNYAGILDKIRVTRIRSVPLRLLVILLIDAAIFLFGILLISIIETIFI